MEFNRLDVIMKQINEMKKPELERDKNILAIRPYEFNCEVGGEVTTR